MKRGSVLLMLVMLAVLFQAGNAEVMAGYQSYLPDITYINNNGEYDARSLNATLYVSDNEIWYSGYAAPSGSWLLHTNVSAEDLSLLTFPDAPGSNPIVHSIAKIDTTLMLGFIDAENQTGTIGLFENGRMTYHKLPDTAKIMRMSSTPKGILALGVIYQEKENVSTLYSAMFSAVEGKIFEIADISADMPVDGYALSTSKCAADDDLYYIQANCGRVERLQPEKTLICYNATGLRQWSIALPETIAVERMSASGGNVFLYGMAGRLDEYDVLVDQQATVLCYSRDGIEKWQKTFDSPERFYFGISAEGQCIAAAGMDGAGKWNICSINTDRTVDSMTSVDFSSEIYVRGIFDTNGKAAMVLGTTENQLFLFRVPI